jgi:hypothetical protein
MIASMLPTRKITVELRRLALFPFGWITGCASAMIRAYFAGTG